MKQITISISNAHYDVLESLACCESTEGEDHTAAIIAIAADTLAASLEQCSKRLNRSTQRSKGAKREKA